MDFHTEWKDFNRQAIGIAAIGLLLCGSLYYFLANAFVTAKAWRSVQTKGLTKDEVKDFKK